MPDVICAKVGALNIMEIGRKRKIRDQHKDWIVDKEKWQKLIGNLYALLTCPKKC